MGEFSITHILLISAIALIFFGPSRLPALGQALGRSINGFKKGLSEVGDEQIAKQLEQPAAPQFQAHQTKVDQEQKV